MSKRKRSLVVPVMYVLSLAMLIGGAYFIERLVSTKFLGNEVIEEDVNEVEEVLNESIFRDIPVVATENVITRPYVNGNVKVVKSYYDYRASNEDQEGAIVYYGNTYMQNSGIDYGMDNEFEVVSILDGTVIEVVDDEIMGKTVKIKHSNELISVYQSMGSVDVKENDKVMQGSIIGKSGTNNVSADLGNHLHFEIFSNGEVVNPEECYDKTPAEIK